MIWFSVWLVSRNAKVYTTFCCNCRSPFYSPHLPPQLHNNSNRDITLIVSSLPHSAISHVSQHCAPPQTKFLASPFGVSEQKSPTPKDSNARDVRIMTYVLDSVSKP